MEYKGINRSLAPTSLSRKMYITILVGALQKKHMQLHWQEYISKNHSW